MRALCTLLVFALPLFGVEPAIRGDVKQEWLVKLEADGVDAKDALRWTVKPKGIVKADTGNKRKLQFAGPPGKYEVELLVVKQNKDGALDFMEAIFVVELTGVAQPAPVEPEPPLAPPVKSTNPFGRTEDMKALIVHETGTQLSAGHISAMYGKDVRQYLDSKCGTGPGGVKEWRIWDQNLDVSASAEHWKKAMSRPRTALPWLLVGKGDTGWEGPLPAGSKETLDILRKVGGT